MYSDSPSDSDSCIDVASVIDMDGAIATDCDSEIASASDIGSASASGTDMYIDIDSVIDSGSASARGMHMYSGSCGGSGSCSERAIGSGRCSAIDSAGIGCVR